MATQSTLKISQTLNDENYYQDDKYLSSSRLANFVSYDRFGKAQYNFPMFLSPTKAEGKAITIGSLVDKVITEGANLDSLVSQKLLKEDLILLCDERKIEYPKGKTGKPATGNTLATYKELLIADGYDFGQEIPTETYNTIKLILERAEAVHYDAHTLFSEYVAECEAGQIVLTDEEHFIKGKLDLLNTKRKRYTDLKTTGDLDKVLYRELISDGYINPYHKYVRQMAIYQQLIEQATGEKYEMELAIFDYKGQFKIIRIAQDALDFAANLNYEAMKVLVDYIEEKITDYSTTLGLNPNINLIGNVLDDADSSDEDEDEEELITEI